MRILSIVWVSQHDKRTEDDYKIIFNCRKIDRKRRMAKAAKAEKDEKHEKGRKRPKRPKKTEKA